MSQSSIETLQISNYVRDRLCNYADESVMIALVREALLLYGAINDVTLVKYLVPLYQRATEVCSETSRFECYRSIAQEVERGTVSINALTPFLLHESSLRIVSTAAIDYAMVNWSSSDEPLAAARQLVGFVENGPTINRAALFGGLVCLGDRRVNELLYPLLDGFTPAEVEIASKATTGFPHIATIEFWLSWLERLSGDANDMVYGHVASGLYRLADDATVPCFVDGERNFGCVHRGEQRPLNGQSMHTPQEVAEMFGPRFRALEQSEGEPKILPDLMSKYSISLDEPTAKIIPFPDPHTEEDPFLPQWFFDEIAESMIHQSNLRDDDDR